MNVKSLIGALLLIAQGISASSEINRVHNNNELILNDNDPFAHLVDYSNVTDKLNDSQANLNATTKSAKRGNRKNGTFMYSAWSNWGKCDANCRQTHERVCLKRRKCGSSHQIEERVCSTEICDPIVMNQSASGEEDELDVRPRNGTIGVDSPIPNYDDLDAANLIEGPLDEDSNTFRNQSKLPDDDRTNEQDFSTQMIKFRGAEKAIFQSPRRNDEFTRWSRWSKCSAKCTTRRFKKCRIPLICKNDIIREVAYCYTENSFCEQWITGHLNRMNVTLPVTGRELTAPAAAPLSNRNNVSPVVNSFQKNTTPNDNLQCGISSRRYKPQNWSMLKIIGGKIARKGQWPWQVAVLNKFKEAFCGGTLISPFWILTAAHCVRRKLYVRLGEHNLSTKDNNEIEFRIRISIKHPLYDRKTVDNDVAMLRLPRKIEKSSYINFACLPGRFEQLSIGKICTIIGWGKRRHYDEAGTNMLHEAQVPIVSNDECKNVYHDYTITDNMFCAGHKRGRIDTCAGDSGGPLLCRGPRAIDPWKIYGITSFGDGCGKMNKFGIYTKLPNYIDWILSVINCDGICY